MQKSGLETWWNQMLAYTVCFLRSSKELWCGAHILSGDKDRYRRKKKTELVKPKRNTTRGNCWEGNLAKYQDGFIWKTVRRQDTRLGGCRETSFADTTDTRVPIYGACGYSRDASGTCCNGPLACCTAKSAAAAGCARVCHRSRTRLVGLAGCLFCHSLLTVKCFGKHSLLAWR